MKNYLLLIAVSLAMAASASADTESQTQTFAFPLSPNSQNLTFTQFDTMGGTRVLQAVTVEATGNIEAMVTIENNSGTLASSVTSSLIGTLSVTSGVTPTLTASTPVSFTSVTVSLTPTDGVADSGLDYHDFGTLSGASGTFSSTLTAPGDDLSAYTGAGTINFNAAGAGGWSFSGVTDATLKIANFKSDGAVKLTYTFNPVPEPSGMALSALAVGMVALRRRRSRD